ncbi:hypothetical protein D3C77_441620 [compost metagenome]
MPGCAKKCLAQRSGVHVVLDFDGFMEPFLKHRLYFHPGVIRYIFVSEDNNSCLRIHLPGRTDRYSVEIAIFSDLIH